MQLSPTRVYVLLFSLYWAQGLPVGFMTHALPVILRAQGVSLAHIGGFGLLMAPWAIKFLWAPWVDRFSCRCLGHYRAWILLTQGLSVVILIVLSFIPIHALNQPQYLLWFFIALLSLNSMGATQDIATDALAVNLLKTKQQHWGNMFQVLGSRLGFIVGGGAILYALDLLTWQATFLILAALVLLNSVAILLFKESHYLPSTSQHKTGNKGSTLQLWHTYRAYFSQNKTLFYWLWVLCSIKVSDGLSGPISKPLLVDMGLSLSQIGLYITMLGAAAALLGAGLASICLQRMQRHHALLLFSILKLLSLFGFVWLGFKFEQGQSVAPWMIYAINAAEDLFAAMLLVVILTLVMQYSRLQHAGTDFTIQVSIMALVSGGLYSLSGVFGDVLGYADYLLAIAVLGILMLWPIWLWRRHYRQPMA
ncbi:acetyl-CoA transporter-like protein [Acinetobacter calcoaceticus]|uniref:Acetyl-CoA transporter-like protein n=1 Tax=Acinetobacter calcoaceticus TaxID=471 RepID=A0A4R1XS91_ACICA|nr:acetyl-CoA transporter-like protein [Acinetobacter calcoaceticus]